MAFKKPEPSSGVSGPELIVFLILLTAIIPMVAGFFAFTFDPLEILLQVRNYFAPFFEKYLFWLKIISVILSILFIWGTVYIIIETNYFIDAIGEDILDFVSREGKFKVRIHFRWKEIKKNLESSDPKNWKKAVIGAENMLNDVLKMSGYLGSKLDDEKLSLLTSAQLSNIEDVKRVHGLWKKISEDPTAELTHDQTKEIVGVFKKSFIAMNLIEK